MGDLTLDLQFASLNFGDLVLEDGDLQINSGVGAVTQNCLQKLRTYLGEWFLDVRVGVPYYEQILVKNPSKGQVDAIFQNVILNTPGVTSLDKYRSRFDTRTRQYFLEFRARATSGTVDYSGLI